MVPVPVRSGRCPPVSMMVLMRSRYWYSSCLGVGGWEGAEEVEVEGREACWKEEGDEGKSSQLRRE